MKKPSPKCEIHKSKRAKYIRDNLFAGLPKVYMCEDCRRNLTKSLGDVDNFLNIRKLQ